MMNQERISREVVIANRSYPLKIYKSDEERILNVVNSVNQKIDFLKSKYDAKDNQDYLAMCILQLYTQNNTSTVPTPSDSNDLLDLKIAEIEALLGHIE